MSENAGSASGRGDSGAAAVARGDSTPALVPSAGRFDGQIAVVGETRIDGTVHGSLRGPGALVIGPGAHIEGQIECASVRSQGKIIGRVVARERVRLAAGTRLDGDLVAPVLEVDDDAVWNGVASVGTSPSGD